VHQRENVDDTLPGPSPAKMIDNESVFERVLSCGCRRRGALKIRTFAYPCVPRCLDG